MTEEEYNSQWLEMDHKVIDNKVYLSVSDIDKVLISLHWLAARSIQGQCEHGDAMYKFILGTLFNMSEVLVGANAAAMVPDTVPDDIIDL